ncbi:hypothetical protein [Hydrogenophaga sp.]|uniref:hypothetical protein n=1 Tax=Hydrogenophaga sp. TaxID=1904254 RepID=UPI002FC8669E
MIDGAEHFHYLGMAPRHHSVLMVFQEGVLILDRDQPGWGCMSPLTLDRLMSDSPAHSPSGSRSGNGSSRSDSDVIDSLSESEFSADSSASTSSSRSGSASPAASRPGSPATPRNGPDARPHPGWSPSGALLGWHPCEAVVHVGPVTLRAINAYKALQGPDELQAFVAQLKGGHWNPQPVGSPGDATMVALQMFGQLQVMLWDGTWHAAGNVEHQQQAMTAQHACQLVANSVVAQVCSLALVPHAERSDYLAHVQSGAISVMVFDQGLLVRSHPDPALAGWHDLDDTTRGAFVSPGDANMIELACRTNYPRENSMFQTFFIGMMDVISDEGPFVAAIFSHKTRRWSHMRLDMPHVQLPNDPTGPTPAAVIQTLRQARPAPLHDLQSSSGPVRLSSGAWQVPLFLGAIQCIDASVDVPGLIGTHWHDTLQPVIERQLVAHHAQEAAWLASGVIKQPIDRLIDLTRRDLALRRDEVWVMWPVELLDDLLKTLAPQDKTRVIHAPKAADVELALGQKACTLFVFQTAGQPSQSVALAQGNRCWSGREHFSLKELKARVTKSLAGGPGEHLVALAYVV